MVDCEIISAGWSFLLVFSFLKHRLCRLAALGKSSGLHPCWRALGAFANTTVTVIGHCCRQVIVSCSMYSNGFRHLSGDASDRITQVPTTSNRRDYPAPTAPGLHRLALLVLVLGFLHDSSIHGVLLAQKLILADSKPADFG